MLSQYNLPLVDRIPVTIGAAALYGIYTVASLAIRRCKRSYFAWKNRKSSSPMLPEEILNVIVNTILESNPSITELLQLGLVNKRWNRLVNNTWAIRNDGPYGGEAYQFNCSILPPKIRSFWHGGRTTSELEQMPRILDPTKRAQYEQYATWMSHNILKYPEILFNFLKSMLVVPEWMYFLIVSRVRVKRAGFYRNEKNIGNIIQMQRTLFVFTTAIPFMEMLILSLKTTHWPYFMNTSSIWSALWTTPRLAVGTQFRLLAILFAFLPFDMSLFLTEAYTPRILLYLVMSVVNGGLPLFATTSAVALGLRKLMNRPEIIPLPYGAVPYLLVYPFSAFLALAMAGVVYLDMWWRKWMRPSLRHFSNAKYWLVLGMVITGMACLWL